MKTQLCTLTAIVSTGMMAGIFFTWTNAVTPGIGKLDDLSYLSAFKSMNRAILNPMFMLLFFLPVIAIPLTGFLKFNAASRMECMLLAGAAVLYITGCFFITVFGNVPLNERLDQAPIGSLSAHDLHQLRLAIEMKWNTYNLIRVLASAGAFVLLVAVIGW